MGTYLGYPRNRKQQATTDILGQGHIPPHSNIYLPTLLLLSLSFFFISPSKHKKILSHHTYINHPHFNASMQDLQQIPGLTGRIFTGTTNLRHLHLNNPSTAPVQPQPVKCPRCDSSNTKFCYYNNYNLSQPRHYCKSCRRYWTKGGVLRNVPVGGGCRKTSKRASSKSKPDKKPAHVPSSGSSSESSSNPEPQTIAPTVAAEAEPRPEAELTAGLIDFTDPSLIQEEKVNGFDWGNGSEDSGSLFDIMNPTVNYWNQTNWGETDPNSLYLP